MPEPLGILWAEPLEPLPVQPIYPNTPASPHVTLAFAVTREAYDIIGLPTSIWFQSECWNDRIQAIRCQLQHGIPFELSIPHLTVSWIDGVEPVESTKMLQFEHQSRALGDLLIPCEIKWVELEDSARAWRSKALAAISQHTSINSACESLGLPRSTVQGWFKDLPSDHPDRLRYEQLARRNPGGWKRGRSRKVIED